MRSSSLAAAAGALAVRGKYDDWKFGNMFNLGPASNAIAKATYTLVPPSIPCGTVVADKTAQPWMSIWVGISQSLSDDSTDLFQPLLNWAPNNAQEGCPAANDAWCVAASTFTGTEQVAQSYVAIPNKSNVDFERQSTFQCQIRAILKTNMPAVTYDASKGVTQKVWINGALVSQQTDKDKNGKAPTWIYSSNECYSGACGTLGAYSWSNLTVTLSEADSNFGDTLQLTGGSSSGIKTTDGGKTWHADSIKINEDYFYTDGSKKQC
ncbi:hypothetical protein K4K49_011782 [Colletotrichum sp. SAR 10_70]|uniref:Uncharacterized protein n=1 Tax=Colletotrichum fructicola (strain Nara gc5) TaxID=1213859 RepID=L2FWT1_COLFN|nr:hypothetical protein K4K50_000583 [Colletotrichum sp. SAR 10_71]KAI8202123.1 hypothetical protein K4K49_011782 [Colletotrichum sp. SAR 10_70]KAI8215104.1 hypothetical protein K4K52_010838 [Colletotrichum sp. SAR 10_76]KAI8237445.1 hypothetical protein K4K54_012856 [Colletotrichum sp. SAR 10_86]KAI8317448.1 hypothetical protein K4K59_006709 [Colletotrichum sp. SAR11_240]KAJ5008349.1 hypothetical protein K4K48_003780 [Colletotrichum sp. SAR 10_66]